MQIDAAVESLGLVVETPHVLLCDGPDLGREPVCHWDRPVPNGGMMIIQPLHLPEMPENAIGNDSMRVRRVLSTWKDIMAAASSLATVLTVIAGGIWGYYQFIEYRYFLQSAVINIHADHVNCADKTCLYLNVEVQNVGNVKLTTKRCMAKVLPYYEAEPGKEAKEDRDNLNTNDRKHIYVLDKGEMNSFAFMFSFLLEDEKKRKLTACRIEITIEASELTADGEPDTWVREQYYLFRPANQLTINKQ